MRMIRRADILTLLRQYNYMKWFLSPRVNELASLKTNLGPRKHSKDF